MKKIYLAGFDVFYPDAQERGERLKQICRNYGFEGLFPLDNVCISAAEIFAANTEMIRKCDIIAANMNAFRGDEPDSGTAFELGYAYAMGKKLYCYLSDIRTLREKIGTEDKDGMIVEDFDLPLNLMISIPAKVVCGEFEDCIRQISRDLF